MFDLKGKRSEHIFKKNNKKTSCLQHEIYERSSLVRLFLNIWCKERENKSKEEGKLY